MQDDVEKKLKSLISTKLQQIRKGSGDSLEKMAEALSLDYSVFYHLYKGAYLPRLTTLWRISRFYNIPIEDWFKELDFAQKAAPDHHSLEFSVLHNFRQLDATTKDIFAKILQRYNIKERKHRAPARQVARKPKIA
ncbi:MAG: helix-turn-helix transcriptional regulator [Candidatus Margulisbacteria bacterium]|jgi:transcriptional regulator with XRE-family HTH domain|nr:helix-turn-helix transcriptional regulator [Candidatus Margulisiibacteriota bacterium]